MNEILDMIQKFNLNRILEDMEKGIGTLGQTELISLTALAVIGLLWCFFGLKLVRALAAVLGLAVGMTAGTFVALKLGMDTQYIWIPGVIFGLVLAILGAWLYRFGIFLTVWLASGAVCVYIIQPPTWSFALLCFAAGLIIAGLAVRFAAVVTIMVTSVFGAALSGTCIYFLLPSRGFFLHAAVCAVLGILGIWVQLLLESKKRKKESLKKAEEIRKAHSTANEVERARAFVDNAEHTEEAEENAPESMEEELWGADIFEDEEENPEETPDEDELTQNDMNADKK